MTQGPGVWSLESLPAGQGCSVVAHLCNLINSERVIVGDDLSLAGEVVLQPLREVVRRSAVRSAAETARIVGGLPGESAEHVGALALVLRDPDGFVSSRLRRAAGDPAAGDPDDSWHPDRRGERPRPARPREDRVPRRR